MSSLFNLTISLLIPFSTGYAFLLWLDQERAIPLALKIALAYGLGLGLLSLWMLCLGMLGQSYNLFSIGMPLVALTVIFLIWYLKHTNRAPLPKKHFEPIKTIYQCWNKNKLKLSFNIFLIILIVLNIIYVFWRSMTIPISTLDAIATVAFKAKIFFFEQSLPPLSLLPHGGHPLFVSFIESWVAFNIGYWDDILVKIIFPFAFLSFLTIHYKFIAHFTNRTWAHLGCVILLSSNFFIYHATISYQDFFAMYFNCITIMLLIYWNQCKTNSFLILGALFAGFTTFTKLEGTGYLFIHTLLVIGILWGNKTDPLRKKFKNFLIFAVPSYLICLAFHIYKISLGVSGQSGQMNLAFTAEHLAKWPIIINNFASNLFFSGNWNIIWFLLFISLICHSKKFWHSIEIKLLAFPLLMFFIIYFIVLTLTPAMISNSGLISRVILHFFPLSVLLIIFLNYSGLSTEGKNTSSLDSMKQTLNK